MDLSDIDRRRFPRKQNKRTKEWYLWMDYEVRVSFDYPRLKYEIIIPRNGKFPDSETWGDDPIRRPAVLNCAAAFEITKPQALATPVRARPSILSSAARDNATDMAGLTRPNLRSADSHTSQRRLKSTAQQKRCQRCRKAKGRCIRRVFGKPCDRCIKAGEECISRS